MAETFFIGDTHFGHRNIIKFEATRPYRQFSTIEEHDAEIIRRWNGAVGKKDIVWHMGDFCFGKKNLEIAAELNGDKRLILGNHDCYPASEYLKYFTKVFGALEWKGMVLSHIPVHPSQLEYRFTHNIHGHLHASQVETEDYYLSNLMPGAGIKDDPRYINVSAEKINLTPINFEEIKAKFL